MEHRASTNDVHAGRAAVKSKFSVKTYFKSQMTKIIIEKNIGIAYYVYFITLSFYYEFIIRMLKHFIRYCQVIKFIIN